MDTKQIKDIVVYSHTGLILELKKLKKHEKKESDDRQKHDVTSGQIFESDTLIHHSKVFQTGGNPNVENTGTGRMSVDRATG